MKREEVIEVVTKTYGTPPWSEVAVKRQHEFANEVERRTLEHAAVEAERMTWYPGGKQQAPAHDTVWHAARAIRALKESK